MKLNYVVRFIFGFFFILYTQVFAVTRLSIDSLITKEEVITTEPPGFTHIPVEDDFIIPEYQFVNGEKLTNVKIHYITLGIPKYDENGKISNAILLLHGTGGNGAMYLDSGLKQALYGPGKPFDANEYFLIFPDNIGHGKSSKPSDGLRTHFPKYQYQDMVDIQYRLIKEKLGISHIKMIMGASMGGTHSWLWSEMHPDFMDGVMPIACFPAHISGRSLLYKRMFIKAIEDDPEWKNGDYIAQPHSFITAELMLLPLLYGLEHLEKIIPNILSADEFATNYIERIKKSTGDANDMIYALKSSADYAPEDKLETIQAKVFALNFEDDALIPNELHILENLIKRVKNGRAVIQKTEADSNGHLTVLHPQLWENQVREFVHFVYTK